MSDPRTDTLVAADAVRRIGEELSHLSGGLRAVEQALFPVIIRAGAAQPGTPAMRELQRFDLILQSIDGLADLLKGIAASSHDDPTADVSDLIAAVRIAALSARLLDGPAEGRGADRRESRDRLEQLGDPPN